MEVTATRCPYPEKCEYTPLSYKCKIWYSTAEKWRKAKEKLERRLNDTRTTS